MLSNSDAYIVNPDGSISETISAKGIDDVIRAFIRVAVEQDGKKAAYTAQRKAIKYLKKHTDCAYPETYVQDLELREFPREFQRAELGRQYTKLTNLAWTIWITGVGIFAYYWIYKGFKKLNAEYADLEVERRLKHVLRSRKEGREINGNDSGQ